MKSEDEAGQNILGSNIDDINEIGIKTELHQRLEMSSDMIEALLQGRRKGMLMRIWGSNTSSATC